MKLRYQINNESKMVERNIKAKKQWNWRTNEERKISIKNINRISEGKDRQNITNKNEKLTYTTESEIGRKTAYIYNTKK